MTTYGFEYWKESEGNNFVARETNIDWLCKELNQQNIYLQEHFPGQFSENYTRTQNQKLQSFIHGFNKAYFKWGPFPLTCVW